MSLNTKADVGCFGGRQLKLSHQSETTGTEMTFNLYLPPQAFTGKKVPVLFYLGGLTCNEDNGTQKGFLQHGCSQYGIALVCPDTSPRGVDIPGDSDHWDFGKSASYYVDATNEPWSKNYRMNTYISEELPKVIEKNYGDKIDVSKKSVSGHSVGGHGALIQFLRHPGAYKSVSAFAPMCNPLNCQWGQKAFKNFFGEEKWQAEGAKYDAVELVKKWDSGPLDILVDVGADDNFGADGQLLHTNLLEAAQQAGNAKRVTLRIHGGYGHSYYTVATFADDHIAHHAKYLCAYETPSGTSRPRL